jgi:hypothetical protein
MVRRLSTTDRTSTEGRRRRRRTSIVKRPTWSTQPANQQGREPIRRRFENDATRHASYIGDHVQGPRDADVTLLQYGDYECLYTRLRLAIMAQLND